MKLAPPPPATAIREIEAARTPSGKVFELPGGRTLLQCCAGAVHFEGDAGKLEEVDTAVGLDDAAGEMVADKVPYRFRLHRRGIGFDYYSRRGGSVQVELDGIGGQSFDGQQFYEATRTGNRIRFGNVAADTDIEFRMTPLGLRTFRILKSASAPRSWAWRVRGTKEIGSDLVGRDGKERRCAGLAFSDTADGPNSFTRRETWDGSVVVRDPETRIPSPSFAPDFPVMIDPDVTEPIAADNDDGHDLHTMPADTHTFDNGQYSGGYYVHNFAISDYSGNTYRFHPGYRFTTVAVNNAATITLAEFKFTIQSVGTSPTGKIYGYKTGNAAAWSIPTGAIMPSVVTRTTAFTSVPAQTTGAKTFDVTSVVQEIVNEGAWASGNAMSLMLICESALPLKSLTIRDFFGGIAPVLEITIAAAGATVGAGLLRGLKLDRPSLVA